MAETFKKLAQAQAGSTAATLYTAPSATQTIVKHVRVVNTDTLPRWIKLWHGGTTDAYLLLPQTTIASGGWAEFDGVLCLSAAETLSVQGEVASKLTVTVYGLEVS